MKTTQEYFNLTIDDLLITDENGWTKEERLLFDEGLNCTFFDSEEELQVEHEQFQQWMHDTGTKVDLTLRTINNRIAVISK